MDVARLVDQIAILQGPQPEKVGHQRAQVRPTSWSCRHRAVHPIRKSPDDVGEKLLKAPEAPRTTIGQSHFNWFHEPGKRSSTADGHRRRITEDRGRTFLKAKG